MILTEMRLKGDEPMVITAPRISLSEMVNMSHTRFQRRKERAGRELV